MRLLIIISMIIITVSCSNQNSDNMSETQLYKLAQINMDSGNYSKAIDNLKKLETRFPFGRFAEQVQLELIYAYHKSDDLDKLLAATERFMRLYPRSNNLDYVYYVKGVTYFEQGKNVLNRRLPLVTSRRDLGSARNAFNEFAELTRRFPDSKYAADAKQRMIYLRNLLAEHEVHVAKYYLQRKAYVAAVNRSKYIIENFDGTPAVIEGLQVLQQAYIGLQMPELAHNAQRVLELNQAHFQ